MPSALSIGIHSYGERVVLLHRDLYLLGLRVPLPELEGELYGEGTRALVAEFQRQHQIEPTGVVDEQTAKRIGQALDALDPWVVEGTATADSGQQAGGVMVRALARELRHEQPLGAALAGAQGAYRITYKPSLVVRPEKPSPNLIVRAYDAQGVVVGVAEHCDAAMSQRIDIRVADRVLAEPSIFERLRTRFVRNFDGVDPAELREGDVDCLQDPLKLFARATRFGRRVQLAPEASYAFARADVPLNADGLLERDDAALRGILEAAVQENVIPAELRDSLDAIMQRLSELRVERGLLTAVPIVLQLVHSETGAPIPGIQVQAGLSQLNVQTTDLGRRISDRRGLARFAHLRRPNAQDSDARLALVLMDGHGEPVHEDSLPWTGEDDVLVVPVPSERLPESRSTRIADVVETLDLVLPVQFRDFLAKNNIATVDDIREQGGLRQLEGLPVAADDAVVRALDAQVNLSVLSQDVALNGKLAAAGYSNVGAIARTARPRFVRELADALGEAKAAELHAAAEAQARVLTNVLTNLRTEVANDWPSTHPELTNTPPELEPWFRRTCECRDCDAAVSPLAYLADLLDYAVTHVEDGGDPITLSFLTETFHQPFHELPATCEAMQRSVRQVRICIEGLRAHLAARAPHLDPAARRLADEAVERAEAQYSLAAYTDLLKRLGTSYAELRLARTPTADNEAVRRDLADRLGIAVTHGGVDQIAALHLEPGDVTEAYIERLFGLADTARDPLSEGAKIGDADAQIERWNLDGADWNHNTDRQGSVHLSVEKPAGEPYRVKVFRDAARTDLVASGTRRTARGAVALGPENDSGLSGYVVIAYSADAADIEIVAVPRLLSWRLDYSRALWRSQQWPADPYRETAYGDYELRDLLPFVDPDVIGPSDFRSPLEKAAEGDPDRPFDLWVKRRAWVDEQIDPVALRADPAEMFASMYDSLRYSYPAPGTEYAAAWAPTTPVSAFADLHDSLERGQDVETITERLRAELHLGVDAFRRMIEIERGVAGGQPLEPDERRELVSILVQARKCSLFGTWRDEEAAVEAALRRALSDPRHVLFGPRHFWIALREPVEGTWPPEINDRPLIDPDLVDAKDLPELPFGAAAAALFEARREELDAIQRELAAQHAAGGDAGFDAMLRAAYDGDPPTGHTDWNSYVTSLSNRGRSDPESIRPELESLHLSQQSFQRIVEVRAKTPESAQAWSEVYALLTSAVKDHRNLPATWRTDERDSPIAGKYWRALKAALPKWRASAQTRQLWLQALRSRSSSPVVDPDVISTAHLRNASSGLAFGLWDARAETIRSDWLATYEAAPRSLEGFRTIVVETLYDELTVTAIGHEALLNRLFSLDERREQGESIAGALDQLGLSPRAFDHLLRVRSLLESGSSVLEPEWEAVYNILVQVQKLRVTADWQREEHAADPPVALGPDHFKLREPPPLRFPPPEPPAPPEWRATWRDLRNWEDTLKARIDQVQSVTAALTQSVSATEEATLPAFRDALRDVASEPPKRLTQRLQIDCEGGGCSKTTRIAQAIETIQGVLWGLRTAQLPAHPDLSLVATDFDAEWQWLGSYASWRGAMLVHIYVENLLYPSLFRTGTPAFGASLESVRAERRFTPSAACRVANEYAAYLKDIYSISVEATCQAETRIGRGNACERVSTPDTRELFYMFARGGETGRIYWSSYDEASEADGNGQTFWAPIDLRVPEFSGVTKIVGSVPYTPDEGEGDLYLFGLIGAGEDRKVIAASYDLEEQRWSSEVAELNTPPRLVDALCVQAVTSAATPMLVLHTADGVYVRQFDPAANAWSAPGTEGEARDGSAEEASENDEWEAYKLRWGDARSAERPAARLGGLRAVLCTVREPQEFLWLVYQHDPSRELRILPVTRHSEKPWLRHRVLRTLPPHASLPSSTFVGACAVGERDEVLVYYYETGHGRHRVLRIRVTGDQLSEEIHSAPGGIDAVAPSFGAPLSGRRLAVEYCLRGASYGRQYGSYHAEVDEAGALSDHLRSAPARRVRRPAGGYERPDPVAFEIKPFSDTHALESKRQETSLMVTALRNEPASHRVYLKEAYFLVPVHLAIELQRGGFYDEALDWLRTVYDYAARPPASPFIYSDLNVRDPLHTAYERVEDWLLDPLDPHAIAETRPSAYLRFTRIAIARCFLEYADAEYARDTAESVPRARTLYEMALRMVGEEPVGCAAIIADLAIDIGERARAPELVGRWEEITEHLGRIHDPHELGAAAEAVRETLARDIAFEESLRDAVGEARRRREDFEASDREGELTLGKRAEERHARLAGAFAGILTQPVVADAVARAGRSVSRDFRRALARVSGVGEAVLGAESSHVPWLGEGWLDGAGNTELATLEGIRTFHTYSPTPSYHYCIPANPVMRALRLHAELNLYKIRNCRNIAGMERQLEPYVAPTDTFSGMPQIGASGQLVLPGAVTPPATPYRYQVLVGRAKELAQLAGQFEAAMFSAIEKAYEESYRVQSARREVALTRQGVRLQDLRIREAEGGVRLAELQRERAQIQAAHYEALLQQDLLAEEIAALELLFGSAVLQGHAAGAHFVAAALPSSVGMGAPTYSPQGSAQAIAGGLSSLAGSLSTVASTLSTVASYKRRREEWELLHTLAEHDAAIGSQQIRLAQDHVRVVGQERQIAQLQANHAAEMLEFLNKKFTNVELYDWMSQVLERAYGFFLREATAVLKLAENQLAFERQEIPAGIVQDDYWDAPIEVGAAAAGESDGADRRGLTGSARLLQDIYRLDQYAFETDARKLQLTKTISLARLAPLEFQRFRETGVIQFRTTNEMFDEDFLGHFLRLIKRVRTSVVALVPPAEGIHATLSNGGLSRVVINNGVVFETIHVRRPPESVALTSPVNATGLFELTPQPNEMLLPFEAIGVDASWELQLPRASNRFDFRSIADVLMTIEFTALSHFDYEQQMLRTLPASQSRNRPFSFRHEFADAWYDLHNPEQSGAPMTVRFRTRRVDFAPNLADLRIEAVTLYVTRADRTSREVPVTHLHFTEEDAASAVGGEAATVDGIISTRLGNAASWTSMVGKPPVGEWELALPNTEAIRSRFRTNDIEDMLFVVTYKGERPPWPSELRP